MSRLNSSNVRWNLKLLYTGDTDPKMALDHKDIEEFTDIFVNKWKDRKDYLENPSILKEALDEYEEYTKKYLYGGNEFYYWWLRLKENENDKEVKAKFNQIEEFSKNIINKTQFFTLNLAKIDKDKQEMFLNSEELKEYKHFLESSFKESKYLLSESEEKIMLLKSSVSHDNWENLTTSLLSKEKRNVVLENQKVAPQTFSEILGLLDNSDPKVRNSSAKATKSILNKISDIAEAELNSILANKKIDDEIRKFERADSSRHLADDMDTGVVDTAIETITSRFDISKKYYELKAKLLKVDSLTYYEKNISVGKVEKNYSYEDSVDLVASVFEDLDSEFYDIFKDFVEKGHMDVFPRSGKDSGAFCVHILKSQPTYIFLNHTNKLRDVLTLAHESGHGINNEMMKRHINALNFHTPTSTAEVASTFMEDFVLKKILENSTEEEKLTIMMQKLNDDVSTIFRQTAFYNFETELHNVFRTKGYLSKNEIGDIFLKHMKSYLGDFVTFPKGTENTWIYISHFRSFFYVYTYATGLLISKSMQNSVKTNKDFIVKIKEFFSAGSTDSPKNIFSKLNIDVTDKKFWENGLDEVENLLEETEILAKKLGFI